MSTTVQDHEFANEMLSHVEVNKSALDAAIEWIQANLLAEDVFSEKELEEWATANGFIKE